MIEILPGVYYDPSKGWYEQDTALIILGDEVMQTAPIEIETEETLSGGQRLIFGVWQTATECGAFSMRVNSVWQFPAMSDSFDSRLSQDIVTVTKIS
jgi:hypothetical protein